MPEPARLADLPDGIAVQALLDAMEGVAWLTDPDGTILAVGQRGWASFAAENAAPRLTADAVIGASLFAAIHGDAVRDAYRHMHAAVLAGRRAETVFEYRCDSPIAERHMRMAITGVRNGEQVTAVLYQSQVLAEVRRLPLPLFSTDLRAAQQRDASRPIVTLCSFCQRVAWPVEPANDKRRRWIPAAEFYRRGGPAEVRVSDDICPACIAQAVAPNL